MVHAHECGYKLPINVGAFLSVEGAEKAGGLAAQALEKEILGAGIPVTVFQKAAALIRRENDHLELQLELQQLF